MKQPATVIAHCDANSFYCSCHRVFEPALLRMPVGVLSNNDGCVIARTPELKAIGVAMGTPFFQVRRLMEQGQIAIRSSNYPLYGDMSERFMSVLEGFTPEVEVYSIDEAFLRFTGFPVENWEAQGRAIQQKVGRWTGLPIGVGISTTKVLAKLANYAAKHYPATGGVVDLTDPERQKRLMAITPVDELWGIGRRLAPRLKEQGILTVRDFANLEPSQAKRQYSVTEERLVRELRGENCLPWDEEQDGNKHTIMCSRSFGLPVSSEKEVWEALATYVSRACEKMRRQGKAAAKAQLFLRTDPFRKDDGQYHGSLVLQIPQASASTSIWLRETHKGLKRIFREGYQYRKAGFVLLDIGSQTTEQGDLFTVRPPSQESSKPELTDVLDSINNRFGNNTLKVAASGNKPARWHMKQNYLSPRYTTQWSDLATVRCKL
ncbi:Y-family DNA polymerase [Sansalvadorimonas verongulae]|uniref:Y-family DNA polymerase n=1 Tax=Sansalvadorimonas verongulae TaxID=2172824 RepID=UPI0012BCA8AB|nr:Y-family DNA polymerase [Sansalvadorimonas verongulae]MTI12510.1 Y-family DNA polymerase [Sansalvadorimonas verongulae]